MIARQTGEENFSLCHSVPYSLAKWLIQELNSILAFHSGICVDDSFTFSSIIHQLSSCVDSQFMVSFDIAPLFAPLDEAISIREDFLYRSPLTPVPSLPESVFLELIELASKSVSFSFNDTMYRHGFFLGPYSC